MSDATSSLRLRYQTIEVGDVDIHVRGLRDKQEFADDAGVAEALGISSASWSTFGVVWDSGRALARLMVDYELGGRRILEVGCGLGLASLVLGQRSADVTATDHHPETEGFLRANARLNGQEIVPYQRAGWSDGDDTLGTFDLIIGSDVLYEGEHVPLLAAFIDRHARPACEVLLIDPGRHHGGRFGAAMTDRGFAFTRSVAHAGDRAEAPFHGHVLRCVR